MSLKIQSEAAVKQFGVLSFPYQSESQQLSIDYVRVRKADGTAGIASNDEKIKVIYHYVSLKFRYSSISLGEGRYRPHTAGELPALIGAG